MGMYPVGGVWGPQGFACPWTNKEGTDFFFLPRSVEPGGGGGEVAVFGKGGWQE